MRFAFKTALISLALASMGLSAADFTENFHASEPLPAGGALTVRNVNGSVEITVWDQDTVDVNAVKEADSQARLNEIRIEVQRTGDGVSVRTVVPEHRNGNMGARLVLKVPRRVNLRDVSSSNGAIRVSGVEGAAKLSTSNGAIRADVTGGSFSAATSNGSIEANLRRSDSREPVVLDTSNGRISLRLDAETVPEIRADTSNSSIELHLPASTGARLEASTSNGGIFSDFDVTTRSMSKDRLNGTIGAGGPLLKLGTSNGAIRVLRN
jgi:DUF4097 and DUF4098 domain-containing protein YvlB